MAANKNGLAPVKASVKRMHRPERMELIERGRMRIYMFLARGGF